MLEQCAGIRPTLQKAGAVGADLPAAPHAGTDHDRQGVAGLLAAETKERITGTIQQSGWHNVFQTLKQRGVDPLTETERKLRRLPIQEIKTLETVFQPRQMDGATVESGKHLGELKRALQAKGELDPITVLKVGGEWLCLDGHHRLEAYRQAGGRRTHIPVRVFGGNLEDAFR
jgi:uncharacterized ParB-like nuclease family protein